MPYAPVADGNVYYEEVGAGHPIIFCHEFAADHRTWENQIRYLGRQYRCITFNALGYPPSDAPDDPEAYGWERQRDVIGALMDHLGIDKAHVVGLSMGAYAALQFALAYPERITALALSSAGSGSHPLDQTRGPHPALATAEALGAGWAAGGDVFSTSPSRVQLQNKDPRGWSQTRAYLHEHPIGAAQMIFRRSMAVRPSLYGLKDALRALRAPVLLMVGDEDDNVIEVNIYLKRVLPRAGLWMAPKTGHPINLEEPAMFNQMLLDFFGAAERGRWDARDPRSPPKAT